MIARITSSLWIVWLVHHSLYGAVSQGMDPLSEADYPNIHTRIPREIPCPSWKPLRSHPKKALPRGLVQALGCLPSLLSPHSKEFQCPNMARILNSLKQQSAPSMKRMAQQSTGTNSSSAFLLDWWDVPAHHHFLLCPASGDSVQHLPHIMPHSKRNWCVPALFCTNLLKFQCKWPDS